MSTTLLPGYPQAHPIAEVIHNLHAGGYESHGRSSSLDAMHIPAALAELAKTQDGIVTRQQALSHGMSADAIKHAIGRGRRWQKMHRGVYATFLGPLQLRHTVRAALLIAGPTAMVSGTAACRAHGMRYAPEGPIVVLVPHKIRQLTMRGVVFRRTRALPTPRAVHGIPCAPPERAVMDAVRDAPTLRAVRAAMCEAVQLNLTTADRLISAATIRQRNDPHVKRTLNEVTAGCRSAPECEILDLVRSSEVLPDPRLNEPLPGFSGIVPDGRWDEARLIYEIDSVEWHRLGDRPEATERRRAQTAALGWRVIPISPRRLREEPHTVLRELEAAYRAGLGNAAGVG